MFMKNKRRSKLLSIKDLTQEFYKKEKIKKKMEYYDLQSN